jgi:hypothetical protein
MIAALLLTVANIPVQAEPSADQALKATALRVVLDAARNRAWMLQSDALYLQEGTVTKRFALPNWTYVREGYACAPALAIDAQGAAVVSSNVISRLWRIDPAASSVTVHDPVLDTDRDKDIGFTGLTFDQGVFYAASSVHGSLWRIDSQLRRAQKIALSAPLESACVLGVERTRVRRSIVLSAQGDASVQTVFFAPDQRSGYVRKGE